jgi:hypothetical protein
MHGQGANISASLVLNAEEIYLVSDHDKNTVLFNVHKLDGSNFELSGLCTRILQGVCSLVQKRAP